MNISIQNQNIKAVINSKGAELVSFENDQQNYIWNVNTAFWNKTSPILFPIVGALKNGEYTFEDSTYQLPRHGFARDFDFEILSKTDDAVTFSLKSSEETLKVYPFHFELRISYILEGKKLIVEYNVINLSDKKMYYSIGAHPAFAIDGNFEEFTLVFDNEKDLETHQLHQDLFSGKKETLHLENKKLPLKYSLFDNDALVFKNFTTKSLTLAKGNQPLIKVDFPDFPYLGIWTKHNAPFICIEPWLGIADNDFSLGNLVEKEGIQILERNTQKTVSWSVEIL